MSNIRRVHFNNQVTVITLQDDYDRSPIKTDRVSFGDILRVQKMMDELLLDNTVVTREYCNRLRKTDNIYRRLQSIRY